MDEHSHHAGRGDDAYVIAASFVVAAIILSASVMYAFNNVNASLQQISSGIADVRTGLASIRLAPPSSATPTPAPAAGQTGKGSLDTAAVKGSNDAKIYLVEYSDFECPFCGRHVTQTAPQIDKNYLDTGKIRHVFKNFPLDTACNSGLSRQMHPDACRASAAALCAGGQGKFWEMHDKLFANQQALSADDLKKYAKDIGLDSAKFASCLDSQATKAAIVGEIQEGDANGISGTPGFLITDAQGNVVGRVDGGAVPYANFQTELDKALAAAG